MMGKTALDMTEKELAQFNPWKNQGKLHDDQRKHRALKIAQKAADMLKSEFNVDEVWVFGSLACNDDFTKWSDIDLAVKGLSEGMFWKAGAQLDWVDDEFHIDLVELETVKPNLKTHIWQEGFQI